MFEFGDIGTVYEANTAFYNRKRIVRTVEGTYCRPYNAFYDIECDGDVFDRENYAHNIQHQEEVLCGDLHLVRRCPMVNNSDFSFKIVGTIYFDYNGEQHEAKITALKGEYFVTEDNRYIIMYSVHGMDIDSIQCDSDTEYGDIIFLKQSRLSGQIDMVYSRCIEGAIIDGERAVYIPVYWNAINVNCGSKISVNMNISGPLRTFLEYEYSDYMLACRSSERHSYVVDDIKSTYVIAFDEYGNRHSFPKVAVRSEVNCIGYYSIDIYNKPLPRGTVIENPRTQDKYIVLGITHTGTYIVELLDKYIEDKIADLNLDGFWVNSEYVEFYNPPLISNFIFRYHYPLHDNKKTTEDNVIRYQSAEKYKVGDKVVIKTEEELIREYGYDNCHSGPNVYIRYSTAIKELGGKEVEIIRVYSSDVLNTYRYVIHINDNSENEVLISPELIKGSGYKEYKQNANTAQMTRANRICIEKSKQTLENVFDDSTSAGSLKLTFNNDAMDRIVYNYVIAKNDSCYVFADGMLLRSFGMSTILRDFVCSLVGIEGRKINEVASVSLDGDLIYDGEHQGGTVSNDNYIYGKYANITEEEEFDEAINKVLDGADDEDEETPEWVAYVAHTGVGTPNVWIPNIGFDTTISSFDF